MDIYEKLGQELVSLRGRRKQSDIAKIIGVSQPYYSRLEKGLNRLQLHQLLELSEKLELTIIIQDGALNITSKLSAL